MPSAYIKTAGLIEQNNSAAILISATLAPCNPRHNLEGIAFVVLLQNAHDGIWREQVSGLHRFAVGVDLILPRRHIILASLLVIAAKNSVVETERGINQIVSVGVQADILLVVLVVLDNVIDDCYEERNIGAVANLDKVIGNL